MSSEHFKLRKDLSIVYYGRTLYRIEATKDIEVHGVKAGELGGYIEAEENLSGNAWVSDTAKVYDHAEVHGDAVVFGNARVSGNAEVFGKAKVYGDAKVSGNAAVSGSARVRGGAEVFGDAWVFDKAMVLDKARVFGDAEVSGNARVRGNAVVFGDKIKSSNDCKNIVNERYNITILPELLKIGCQCHTKQEWWNFTDREIIEMDGKDGLKWWKKWKPILMAICEEEEREVRDVQ